MVLFLDFDGVVHPDGAEIDRFFGCAPLIETVLLEFESVQVIISSSWREVHPLKEIREFFAPDIAARIVGATPPRA